MTSSIDSEDRIVVVRGAGDIASGTGRRLFASGFSVVMTEIERPLCVRRTVSFADVVYSGSNRIEAVEARLAQAEGLAGWSFDEAIAVVVDPAGATIEALRPDIVIDARMLKRNADTRIDQAPVVGALGPGFNAGTDCHFVVETKRGHDLGRVIYEGPAKANTGSPAERGGAAGERVLYSKRRGVVESIVDIGDTVEAGTTIFRIDGADHATSIRGVVRGLVREGVFVEEGVKVSDVDPVAGRDDCYTISDRSNAIAGGVLEGILRTSGRNRS